MLFNSIDFAIFFPIVFFIYWAFLQKNIRLRNIFLIIASYVFYGWWDWRFLSLIIISSTIDFIAGQKIYDEERKTVRKRWLLLSIIVNLGFLGFFKYYNFFVDSFVDAFSLLGADFNPSTMNIILPVGISFYTFQTLSYTLDIYYRKMTPTKDVFSFFAFVAFFPQLVAGPIERARSLLPQFFEKRTITYDMVRSGLLTMAWGFFKKIVVADRLARFVDAAYADIPAASGKPAIMATIFFAFQLYLDFSAYSDIAIGSARTMGFNLSTNFRRPYLSDSFSDFWKRWHISLSSWFRDYVYIPLGGSRRKQGRVILNVMIVFVVSGLWHGAAYNFLIWGAINGLFIIVFDRLFRSEGSTGVRRVFMSIFVSAAWALSLIFFRAETFSGALEMYGNLFAGGGSLMDFGLSPGELKFILWALFLYMVVEVVLERKTDLYTWFVARHFLIRWAVYLFLVVSTIMLGAYGAGLSDNNFIYFQF